MYKDDVLLLWVISFNSLHQTNIHCYLQCIPATWVELQSLHMIFFFLNTVMWVCLYHSSTVDPGYLPRNIPEYDRAIKEVILRNLYIVCYYFM